MKFGKDLIANMIPEWETYYIDYRKLKNTLKRIAKSDKFDSDDEAEAAEAAAAGAPADVPPPPPVDAPAAATDDDPTEEDFFMELEDELAKVNTFFLDTVGELERALRKLAQNAGDASAGHGAGHGPNRCLLYTSPSPRDQRGSRMPSSA